MSRYLVHFDLGPYFMFEREEIRDTLNKALDAGSREIAKSKRIEYRMSRDLRSAELTISPDPEKPELQRFEEAVRTSLANYERSAPAPKVKGYDNYMHSTASQVKDFELIEDTRELESV